MTRNDRRQVTTSPSTDTAYSREKDSTEIGMTYARTLFIFSLSLSPLARAQEVTANATRPSVSDNAFLTSWGYSEIEVGWLRTPTLWNTPSLLKFSLQERIELAFAMTGLFQEGQAGKTDLGTPGAQVKWQFFRDGSDVLAAVARIDWPSGSPPVYTLYPVLSTDVKNFHVDVTAGATFSTLSTATSQGTSFYAFSVAPNLESPFGVFAEAYGVVSSDPSVHSIDVGGSYAVTPRLIIDAAVAFGLSDSADKWTIQVGFTSTLIKMFQ